MTFSGFLTFYVFFGRVFVTPARYWRLGARLPSQSGGAPALSFDSIDSITVLFVSFALRMTVNSGLTHSVTHDGPADGLTMSTIARSQFIRSTMTA
jgi:hypothetical protein